MIISTILVEILLLYVLSLVAIQSLLMFPHYGVSTGYVDSGIADSRSLLVITREYGRSS